MKYAFFERNHRLWPVSMLCEVLEVSPSGHPQYQQRAVPDRPHRNRIVNDALLAYVKRLTPKSKANTADRTCGRNRPRAACAWAFMSESTTHCPRVLTST